MNGQRRMVELSSDDIGTPMAKYKMLTMTLAKMASGGATLERVVESNFDDSPSLKAIIVDPVFTGLDDGRLIIDVKPCTGEYA